MYENRRKHYPKFPKSLNKAIDQLKNLYQYDFFQFQGNQFHVHVHDEKNIICLTTLSNINLLTESTNLFADGTFDYAPNIFTIIHYSLLQKWILRPTRLFLFA